MGTGGTKQLQQSEVHVVVVQPKEDGSISAKVVTKHEGGSSSHEEVTQHTRPQRRPEAKRQPTITAQREAGSHNDTPRQHGYGSNTPRQHGYGSSRDSGRSAAPVQPSSEDQTDNPTFKRFITKDGEEYTVFVREDGKLFYVDWEQQKWRVFPSEWCEHGTFELIQSNTANTELEREGEFIHPFRGKLNTLLRQESLNVLYFYDDKSKSWLPMPISWEQHTPMVAKLVASIKHAAPQWTDDRSIVALLRQCNYNSEDALGFHYAINDEGAFDKFKDPSTGHAVMLDKLQQQIKDLEGQVSHLKDEKNKCAQKLLESQEETEELKSENSRLKLELQTIKKETHKQSVSLRQSFGRGALRLAPVAVKMNMIRPVAQTAMQEIRAIKFKLHSTKSTMLKNTKAHDQQMQKVLKIVQKMSWYCKSLTEEVEETKTLYRREALQRKLLFNEIQELRGNIRVFCRCRYDDNDEHSLEFAEGKITCRNSQGTKKLYEFENVYSPTTTQEKVFEDTKPIITSCVDGYNVCIIAYGQTGAGKTYTMMGPENNPGVNLRSIKELFRVMREKEKVDFTMTVSIVEVYNECIYDLLASTQSYQEKLQTQKKGKDIIIPGLTNVEVRSEDDVVRVMSVGERNRSTASTKMNTNSSRSHLLLMLQLESYDTVSHTTTRGRLTLVDLAGSERIKRSEASGLRLVEAAAINKSLSALGQVFASIRDKALHIPYRNSKLTHILQPSLGGDAKACMFVNISPLHSNLPETISTLEFGSNARQVALGKASKNVTKHTHMPTI